MELSTFVGVHRCPRVLLAIFVVAMRCPEEPTAVWHLTQLQMAYPCIQRFEQHLAELEVAQVKDRACLQNHPSHLEEKHLFYLTPFVHNITNICLREVPYLSLGLLIPCRGGAPSVAALSEPTFFSYGMLEHGV
jgi:hypothetical protein